MSKQEKKQNPTVCEWLEVIEDFYGITYETECENKFVCGDYEKLYKHFQYCIYCGKKIKVKKQRERL